VPDRTEFQLGGKVLEPPQKYDPELVLRIVAAVTEYFVQAHRVGSFETLLQRIAEEKAKERRHKAGLRNDYDGWGRKAALSNTQGRVTSLIRRVLAYQLIDTFIDRLEEKLRGQSIMDPTDLINALVGRVMQQDLQIEELTTVKLVEDYYPGLSSDLSIGVGAAAVARRIEALRTRLKVILEVGAS
jgi:hypothetical protein